MVLMYVSGSDHFNRIILFHVCEISIARAAQNIHETVDHCRAKKCLYLLHGPAPHLCKEAPVMRGQQSCIQYVDAKMYVYTTKHILGKTLPPNLSLCLLGRTDSV